MVLWASHTIHGYTIHTHAHMHTYSKLVKFLCPNPWAKPTCFPPYLRVIVDLLIFLINCSVRMTVPLRHNVVQIKFFTFYMEYYFTSVTNKIKISLLKYDFTDFTLGMSWFHFIHSVINITMASLYQGELGVCYGSEDVIPTIWTIGEKHDICRC